MSIESTLRAIIREEIMRALAENKENAIDPLNELPLIMNAKDISKALQCSQRSAYAIMEEEGFPLIRIRKMKRVKREDFFEWIKKIKEK